jgi:alpha-L-fucosidase
MNIKLPLLAAGLLLNALLAKLPAQQVYQANWQSLKAYKTPAWFEDAKFGIFIHWGVYSVPAFGSEWYPREMYRSNTREFKHHIEKYGPQIKFGYKDFIPLFKAEKFNATEWINLFKKSGAKYIVPVAEHHDGFAMYKTSMSKWNAAVMGPKRDVIGELAEATKKAGLIFGVSSHRIEHWWFMNGGMEFDSDVRDPGYQDFYGPAMPAATDHRDRNSQPPPSAEYLDDWYARTLEIVDKYHPQLVYFDWWIDQYVVAPYLQKFAADYYNRAQEWQQGVVINSKHTAFPEGIAVLDVERGQLSAIHSHVWQTDTSVSTKSWGYIQAHEYRSAGALIHDLVDIVSKNGTFLLNIGPRPDGTIPEEEERILLEIGKWLEINGEAIYGTRPWRIFGEGPTQIPIGEFTDAHREPFTGEDIRFTTKGNVLYAIVFACAQDEVTIRSLESHSQIPSEAISDITLLGYGEPLVWSQNEQGLAVQLPEQMPCEHAFALRVRLRDG